MKTKSIRKVLLGISTAALSGAMIFSAVLPAWRDADRASAVGSSPSEPIRNITGKVESNLEDYLDPSVVTKLPETVSPDREISVILKLDTETVADGYDSLGETSLSLGEYAVSREGKAISARIGREGNVLRNKLRNAGVSFTLGNSYDTLFGGFEVTIRASAFDKLCNAVSGDATVIVGEVYNECETQTVENEVDVYDTGIFDSSDSEYDGSGTVIAVLDTGLDYTHSAFDVTRFDPSEDDRITIGTLNPLVSRLAASRQYAGLTASDLYYSRKVPFTFDYADHDPDVSPINSEHGTHVAGIMVGNDYDPVTRPDGIIGVAPNAQLAVMKVFSERDSGARSSWLLAALEDCVTLGVDVINMSLGSSCGFSREEVDDIEVQKIYDSIKARGISLVTAASNDYNSTFGSEKNGNLGLTSNPDSATVGSPSTYAASLSVASISGKRRPYILHNGTIIYFTESSNRASEPKDFFQEILGNENGPKEFEYIVIDGIGRDTEYPQTGVEGRIALVKRGITNFEEKARIAQAHGAVGCIIYNNVSGDISMTVGNVDFPVCSVSQDDGELLVKAAVDSVGKITIGKDQAAGPFMSDFSSWGPSPDLSLKPEITAHGGDIYSAVPGQRYDRLSGTSMASPNQAGVTALIRQYVKANFPSDVTSDPVKLTEAVNQLMMSTADIARNTNGLPFSVRKQGAGLVNLAEATSTPAYVRTFDRKTGAIMDKAKIELGDDPAKEGVYTLKFQIVNLSSTPLTYEIGAYVMTEGVSETLTFKGDTTVTEKGYILGGATITGKEGTDGKTVTVGANSTVDATVEIALGEKDKQYLDDSFANGMYVEGFLTLTAKEGTEIGLNVPYLAFYGDWTQAPLFDMDYFETNKDELDDSKDTLEKTLPDAYATRPLGGLYDDYITELGAFAYLQDPASSTKIAADRDHVALTNQTGETGGVNSIYSVYCGLLRGAKRMVITITDAVTGEVIYEATEYNLRKCYNYGGGIGPSNLEVKFNVADYNLKNNTKYNVTLTGYLDYERDGLETNRRNTFEFPFYTDFEAPIVTGVEYTYEYDNDAKKNRLFANVSVFDNHYIMGIIPGYMSENGPDSEYRFSFNGFGRYITPVQGGRNMTNVIRIELTDHLDEIKQSINGRNFALQVMDYASNTAHYEITIPDELQSITFPEEENGGISISPNQTLALKPTVFPAEGTSWAETINYISSNEDIVRVVNGKLVGVSSGTATITAVSNSNENIRATLTVKVLSESDPGYRSYTKPIAESFTLTGYYVNKVFYMISSDDRDLGVDYAYTDNDPVHGEQRFVEFTGDRYALKMFPSESITLKYELEGYFKSDDYKVEFVSNNSDIVTVTSDGTVTARNVDSAGKPLNLERSTSVTIRLLMRDASGEYKPTTTLRQLSITVKESYVTNGPYLMEYKGLGGTVEIPADFGVTEIQQYAFSNYHYIPKDLAAGDVIDKEDPYSSKIWYIGDNTIKEVIIPEGVEVIGPFAFANLTALEKVTFPSTLTKIQTGAFYGCTSLQSVEFRGGKNNLQFINQDAFADCPLLLNFNFTSIIALGDRAFENSGLMRITLPETAQSIGASAFANCPQLDRITIRAEKVKLGAAAFANCPKLEMTDINASVLPANLFEGCTALKNITLGKDVAVIAQYALRGTGIQSISVADGNENFEVQDNGDYLLEKGTGKLALVAPSVQHFAPANASAIKTVGSGAFSTCTSLTSVDLPQVTVLEDYAFAGCLSLTSVRLGTLTNIGAYAFYGTMISTRPEIAEGAVIGDYAFAGYGVENYGAGTVTIYAPAFRSVEIPRGVTLGNYAFTLNFNLDTLTVGDNVTIGEGAFYMAPMLRTVTIGDGVTIGSGAFQAMPAGMVGDSLIATDQTQLQRRIYAPIMLSALTTLDIGDNVTIGDYAFYGAGSYRSGSYGGQLTSVSLGNNVTIGDYAFHLCRYLTQIDLSGVTAIGAHAFDGELPGYLYVQYSSGSSEFIEMKPYLSAASMTSIDLTACESIGEGAFANNSALTTVKLGDALTSIPAGAFRGCTQLNEVNLSGISEISDSAFEDCDLESVEFASDASIGASAFKNNASLATATGLERAVYIGDESFRGTALKAAIVPAAKYVGTLAFAFSAVKNVSFGSALEGIGENPFAGCEIPAFTDYVNGETADTYDIGASVKVIEGVLYRVRPNGLELVTYPIGRAGEDFTMSDETVRVGAYAFYETKLSYVTLGENVGAIGDRAFYGCDKLSFVVFRSLEAPVLEEAYDPDIEDLDEELLYAYFYRLTGIYYLSYTDGTEQPIGLGIVNYRSWSPDPTNVLYGANFLAEIGTEEGRAVHEARQLVMIRPVNGLYYDTYLYRQYFDFSVNGEAARTAEAKTVVNYIKRLPSNITLADEAFVKQIRALYDGLPVLQQALITNYETLTNAEGTIAFLRQDVDEVSSLFAALPDAGAVTLADEEAITDARARYDSLSSDKKAYVTGLDRLEAAERRLAELKENGGGSNAPGMNGTLKTVLIVVGSVAAAVLVAVALLFLLKKGKKNADSDESEAPETFEAPEAQEAQEPAPDAEAPETPETQEPEAEDDGSRGE